MNIFRVDQRNEWEIALKEAFLSDFYHTHSYHALAEERGEGTAHLWVYREDGYTIALPLLVRSLEGVDGLGRQSREWWDAVSVYGYGGPVASHEEIPESIVQDFQRSLSLSMQERRIISVFSRLHPLIPSGKILSGLGEQIFRGNTVSIDLTLTPEEQRMKFRGNYRRDLGKLRRSGLTFLHDKERNYLSEFVEIYSETMMRVGAERKYFFDEAYFRDLFDRLGQDAHLFFIISDGSPVCGGMFIEHRGILEYHLGGTRNDGLRYSPMKVLIDEARLWAVSKCLRVMHLGGGVGAQQDSLFRFKAGFSDRRHSFSTWQWIVDPEKYETACLLRSEANESSGFRPVSEGFFPQYRGAVEPIDGLR